MSKIFRRVQRDESGFGLITVIGFSGVITLLVVVAVASAQFSLRSSSAHVRYTQSVDAAESGIDQMLARITATRTAGLARDELGPAVGTTFTDAVAEEAWARKAIEIFATANPTLIHSTPQGEFLAIAPPDLPVIYSLSWVPSRADPQESRLLKSEYLFSTYRANYAILSENDLSFAGSVTVSGCSIPTPPTCPAENRIPAPAHTNGDVTVSNNSVNIDGTLTSAGTFDVNNPGSFAAGSGGSAPEVQLPNVDPRKISNAQREKYDGDAPADLPIWYDFCPDGTVRRPHLSDLTPCAGTAIAYNGNFFGWTHSTPGGVSTWDDGGGTLNGVIYVYQGNARIDRNVSTPWQVTILAESARSSPTSCDKVGGNIFYDHRFITSPALPGLILAAGQDLGTGSNFDAGTGLFTASDQMDLDTSSAILRGAVIAAGECDVPGSPVLENTVQGIGLVFSPGLDSVLGDQIRNTLWLEL